MQCRLCGSQLPEGATYCPNCGAATPYNAAGRTDAALPSDPTEQAPPPPPIPSYGSEYYGMRQQNNPYEAPTYYPPGQASPFPTMPASPQPPQPRRRLAGRTIAAGLVGLVILLILSGVVGVMVYQNHVQQVNAGMTATAIAPITATARANNATIQAIDVTSTALASLQATATATLIAGNPDPYFPTNGRLTFYDPLSGPDLWVAASQSSVGFSCQFTNGVYQLSLTKVPLFDFCYTVSINVDNYAFEVQMTMLRGDCGGIVFRADAQNDRFYFFEVCQDGDYGLYLYVNSNGADAKVLAKGFSSAIHRGLHQLNLIAVVANGGMLAIYANHQELRSVQDSTYNQNQQIGLVVEDNNTPSEVAYSNVKVWTF